MNQVAFLKFDYYLGRSVDAEDPNGVTSSGYYDDVLDRPKTVIRASNQSAPLQSQSVFSYDDAKAKHVTAGAESQQAVQSEIDRYNQAKGQASGGKSW